MLSFKNWLDFKNKLLFQNDQIKNYELRFCSNNGS